MDTITIGELLHGMNEYSKNGQQFTREDILHLLYRYWVAEVSDTEMRNDLYRMLPVTLAECVFEIIKHNEPFENEAIPAGEWSAFCLSMEITTEEKSHDPEDYYKPLLEGDGK